MTDALRSRAEEAEAQAHFENAKRVELASLLAHHIRQTLPLLLDAGVTVDVQEASAVPLAKPTPKDGA